HQSTPSLPPSSFLSPSSSLLHSPTSFSFNDPATTEIYTLSLHDALPISHRHGRHVKACGTSDRLLVRPDEWCVHRREWIVPGARSEEHTSELQSLTNLVCRLLLEKKKKSSTRCKSIATG